MNMESAVEQLEKSVVNADQRLDRIAYLVDCYEKKVVNCDENQTNVSVLSLLQSVTQVKEDYANLRRDLNEVQELQRQVQNTVRYRAMQVHQRYQALRTKIISKANNK